MKLISPLLQNPLKMTTRASLLFLALASAVVLLAALVAQYGFELAPCELCLLQRYPYLAVIGIGIAAALFLPTEKWRRHALLLCIALLIVGCGIAVYHTGVEWRIFTGPSDCSNISTGGETLEELRRQIYEAPLVSCGQAMAEIFGLSLAAWNALIYAFLILIAAYSYYRNSRFSLLAKTSR